MKIGYVRVSAADQNVARQIKAMQEEGVEKRLQPSRVQENDF